jgi:hypothetical protein
MFWLFWSLKDLPEKTYNKEKCKLLNPKVNIQLVLWKSNSKDLLRRCNDSKTGFFFCSCCWGLGGCGVVVEPNFSSSFPFGFDESVRMQRTCYMDPLWALYQNARAYTYTEWWTVACQARSGLLLPHRNKVVAIATTSSVIVVVVVVVVVVAAQ